ncbi:MAG: DNA polymerase III subunit delta [Candidatus Acidiferrales bacterium]
MPASSHEQLLTRLAKGKLVATVLLLGEDLYLREMCRAKLIEAYVPEEGRQWGVSRFSLGDVELDRVLQQAETLPMLTPQQVIFVEGLDALDDLGDDARETAVERLAKYLENPAPFTLMVLEAAKLDQRTKLAKMLGEKALVVSVELSGAKDGDERRAAMVEAAKPLVKKLAADAGAQIDADAADELATILNGELARIRTEVEKLATYVGKSRRITLGDVDALVVAEQRYSVWQLADMLAARDRKRALVFLDSLLREGEHPAQLVGALAWMYRKLIQAHEAPPHMNKFQAAGAFRMRPETAEVALRSAKQIPRAQLLAGLSALYEADSRLKGGAKGTESRAVMEFLLTRLTA